MKKKLTAILSAVLFAGTLANGAVTASANNYENTTFSFYYQADGTDTSIRPREKMDNTASYVKLNSSSTDLMVCVAGTNSGNGNNAINPNRCSNVVYVARGDYKYLSNTVYGNYKYAYLVMGSGIGGTQWVSGEWSPDNISGRY